VPSAAVAPGGVEAAPAPGAFEPAGEPDWVCLNADEAGYYRWSLAGDQFDRLVAHGIPFLSGRERIGLVEQCSALLEAGKLRGDQYIELLAQFASDREPHVLEAVIRGLRFAECAFVD